MDVDEFAQTRGPDDLFDEDYTPVTPIVTTQSVNAELHPHQDGYQHQHQHREQNSYQNANTNTRGNGQLARRSRHRNRNDNNISNRSNDSDNLSQNRAATQRQDRRRDGRQRGDQNRTAERGKKQGLAESKWSGDGPKGTGNGNGDGSAGDGEDAGDDVVEKEVAAPQDSEGNGAEQEHLEPGDDAGRVDARTGDGDGDGGEDGEDGVLPMDDEVSEMMEKGDKVEKREAAVRGDRSATGGPKRTKLTEAELTARLSEMSLKNASLTAAHKRAEADEASFQAREAKAATRRVEERANRTQMLGERERNAQRKLRALGHREWDVNKREEDYSTNGTRGSGRRGMARGGGAGAAATTAPAPVDERYGYETRPRRGNRHGGGGSRGNSNVNKNNGLNSSRYAQPQQSPPDQNADFPPLPTVTTKQDEPSVAPAQSKPVVNLNPKETERSTNGKEEHQRDGVERSTAKEPEPIPSADPERKESLTMSELGGQPGGQSASWADQVEGATA